MNAFWSTVCSFQLSVGPICMQIIYWNMFWVTRRMPIATTDILPPLPRYFPRWIYWWMDFWGSSDHDHQNVIWRREGYFSWHCARSPPSVTSGQASQPASRWPNCIPIKLLISFSFLFQSVSQVFIHCVVICRSRKSFPLILFSFAVFWHAPYPRTNDREGGRASQPASSLLLPLFEWIFLLL